MHPCQTKASAAHQHYIVIKKEKKGNCEKTINEQRYLVLEAKEFIDTFPQTINPKQNIQNCDIIKLKFTKDQRRSIQACLKNSLCKMAPIINALELFRKSKVKIENILREPNQHADIVLHCETRSRKDKIETQKMTALKRHGFRHIEKKPDYFGIFALWINFIKLPNRKKKHTLKGASDHRSIKSENKHNQRKDCCNSWNTEFWNAIKKYHNIAFCIQKQYIILPWYKKTASVNHSKRKGKDHENMLTFCPSKGQ